MVVHRAGGYVEGPAKPRSWLGAIAVRIARSARRATARRREEHDHEALDAMTAAGTTPADAAQASEQLFQVQRALDALDVEHRAAFVLFEIEGEPCQSIAEAMGVPIGTIHSRLHVARRRFAAAFAAQARERDSSGVTRTPRAAEGA